MDTNALVSKFEAVIPGAVLEARSFGRSSSVSLWIEMQSIEKVAEILKADPALSLDWLENLSAMDIDQAMVLTYFLRSTTTKESLVLRGSVVPRSSEAPVDVASVAKIWPMAEPFEKEIGDLFGIRFGSTDSSKRYLLPQKWVGYPLRKAYVFPSEFLDVLHMRPAGQTGRDEAGALQ